MINNLMSMIDNKQVCLVRNRNSQGSVVLGQSFSVVRNELCLSVLMKTLDKKVSIQCGMTRGYA